LRHQGRITSNYLLLMAVGGIIAAAGVLAEPAVAIVAYVASAIIAPGFEPVAKIPLGIVLRRGEVLKVGIVSTIAGYAALMLAAAATYCILSMSRSRKAACWEGSVLVTSVSKSAPEYQRRSITTNEGRATASSPPHSPGTTAFSTLPQCPLSTVCGTLLRTGGANSKKQAFRCITSYLGETHRSRTGPEHPLTTPPAPAKINFE
jgi:hypothetical protein